MTMKFTGERFVPSEEGKIRYEHFHRYALSLAFAKGKSVLDIASGEGYGPAVMSSAASSVTGVDLDFESVQHATRRYAHPGLNFVVGSCDLVPLPDAHFDVITSFETIEHHDKHDEMLAEILRLLKPGGTLVISSPNRTIYSDKPGYTNPFHVKELDYDEFDALLRSRFKYVRLYGQRMAAGSFVFSLEGTEVSSLTTFTSDQDQISEGVCSLSAPAYFVAVCSDSPWVEEREINSVYLDRARDLLEILESDQIDQIGRMRDHVKRIEDELASQSTDYQGLLRRQNEEMREARAGYESQIRVQHDDLVTVRNNNERMVESVQTAGEELTIVHGLLSDAQTHINGQERAISRQSRTISSNVAMISSQAQTISTQTKLVNRQTAVLDWMYSTRAWRITSRIRKFGEVVDAWYRLNGRFRDLLFRSRNGGFQGRVEIARHARSDDALEVSGWAYSRAGRIVLVEAFLDDRYVGRIRIGLPRTDVVSSFSEVPLECGFGERIPMAARTIEDPCHLKIRVYDERGNRQIYNVTLPVEPTGTILPEALGQSLSARTEWAVDDVPDRGDTAESESGEFLADLTDVVLAFQRQKAEPPSVLDWNSGLNLPGTFPDLAVSTSPLATDSAPKLPFFDNSFDIVVTSAANVAGIPEARRVSTAVVIRIGIREADAGGQSRDSISVEWHEVESGDQSLPEVISDTTAFDDTSDTSDTGERSIYDTRVEQELRNFVSCDVNVLPEIYSYWANRYLLPKFEEFGYKNAQEFICLYITRTCKQLYPQMSSVVSLGSRNCELDVDIAMRLQQAGVENYVIECLDLNETTLERGRALAKEKGLSDRFRFSVVDVNEWEPAGPYQVIMAIQSLHHYENLEGLFEKTHGALAPDGFFVTDDMIGRNGHLRWPEALSVINDLWQELPAKYHYNHQLKRIETEYENWDCSTDGFEGIRSQDILPLLIKTFHFEFFMAFGNLIDIFIDRGFGPNFDPNEDYDREFIDRVHALDEELIANGTLKPTHMMAAMTKTPQETRTREHLTPEFCIRRPS